MGSGLQATVGFGKEVTPGTAVAPTRWLPFNSESFAYQREKIQGEGLVGGDTFGRDILELVTVATGVEGSFGGDLRTRGLGLLIQQMLGTTAPVITQQGTTTAYRQTFVPGLIDGKSLTIQKKVPFSGTGSSTHTYNGGKITSWEISCGVGEIATYSFDFDAVDETLATAYTTPAYLADSGLFTFKDGTIFRGGTVSVTGGVATLTGGVSAGCITAVSVTGTNALDTDDRCFGTNGQKSEQVEEGHREVSGSLTAHFSNLDLYNLYRADTTTAIEVVFVSPLLAGVGFPCEFRILIPAAKLTGETPQVGGPERISQTMEFQAGRSGSLPMVQVQTVSPDATV